MAVLLEVVFQMNRAGHEPGDKVLMTSGAAERLALRGVVEIVGEKDSEPKKAPEPRQQEAPVAKRRGRPPKVR